MLPVMLICVMEIRNGIATPSHVTSQQKGSVKRLGSYMLNPDKLCTYNTVHLCPMNEPYVLTHNRMTKFIQHAKTFAGV